MLDMCAKVVELSATFEQQYKEILIEFAKYCNTMGRISLVDERDIDDFIKMKMERWK